MKLSAMNPKFWMLLFVTAQTGIALPAIAATPETTDRSSIQARTFDLNVSDLEGTTLSETTTEPILMADRGNDVDLRVDFDRR